MKRPEKSRQVTCQARIELDEATDQILASYAELMSAVERKLFSDITKGKKPSDLKSLYLKEYGLTARQFNSIRIELQGKMASCKECQKRHLSQLVNKIKSLQKRAGSLEKKKKWSELHQVKRRIFNTEKRREKEACKKDAGKISLCFGGKKLFSSQFHREENDYPDHAAWKKLWQAKRNGNFFLVGSKDESVGNQTCQIKQQEDGKFSLTLRLPNRVFFLQKTITLSDIAISYRKKELLDCIKNNEARKLFAKLKNAAFKEMGQAINFRFLKDKKGWRVFITFEIFEPKWINLSNAGSIGIDINVNHLAMVETDRFGNLIAKKTFPLSPYGKSAHQSLALIGDVSAQIVAIAKERQKPIILENLDFDKKKATLNKTEGKKRARMLSSFAYRKIIETIQSRAWSEKIEVFGVNAAYTSVIGRVNYAKKYGLSIHHAAALVIARRHMGFSEKPSCDQVKIPDGKGDHVTFLLPERNRGKHVWSYWARVIRGIKAVFVKHFRRAKGSSSDPPRPISERRFSGNCGRDSRTLDIGKAAWPMQLVISANV